MRRGRDTLEGGAYLCSTAQPQHRTPATRLATAARGPTGRFARGDARGGGPCAQPCVPLLKTPSGESRHPPTARLENRLAREEQAPAFEGARVRRRRRKEEERGSGRKDSPASARPLSARECGAIEQAAAAVAAATACGDVRGSSTSVKVFRHKNVLGFGQQAPHVRPLTTALLHRF